MADVRGRGLLWGFEFVTDRDTRAAPAVERAANQRFVTRCFDNGLLVYPCGVAPLNNAILIAPPQTISEREVKSFLEKLEISLPTFGGEIGFHG